MANTKPNLDLIQMVQRARLIHDSAATPSQIGGVYWIEAKPQRAVQSPTSRAGYWSIPTTTSDVDALWEQIKHATENGILGYKAKVSTAPSPGKAGSEARLILVCTYDADDTDDVAHVREALRKMGITAELHYQQP
jgi:Basophilic leukemia-expressed protein Bles03